MGDEGPQPKQHRKQNPFQLGKPPPRVGREGTSWKRLKALSPLMEVGRLDSTIGPAAHSYYLNYPSSKGVQAWTPIKLGATHVAPPRPNNYCAYSCSVAVFLVKPHVVLVDES